MTVEGNFHISVLYFVKLNIHKVRWGQWFFSIFVPIPGGASSGHYVSGPSSY